jgi:ParB-like chromosome segregation protein Spo0J
MQKIEFKIIPTNDLIPYARNSRTHSEDQVTKIASSIKEFGFLNPIIIDGENGIVAGHGRVMAAKKLGLTELPCIEASHLTEAKKRAYVLADNRLALDAGWDNDLLKIELQDLNSEGFDLSLTGFDLSEISAFLEEPTEGLTDEDAVPEAPEVPVTVEGDVWLLGRHRLMCGDSTSIDAVERLMDGQKADMVFTDPPYGYLCLILSLHYSAKSRRCLECCI